MSADHVVILIPVYNDWTAVSQVLTTLDSVMAGRGGVVSVLLVDDGSSEPIDGAFDSFTPTTIDTVTVLPLRRNLGHQRAIALGLAYVADAVPCREVVVMDGDGEDSPHDVPRLLDRCRALGDQQIVFAERTRRVDRLVFRLLYTCYRFVHWLLTGVRVRVGNFSAVPAPLLRRLVVVSELWNHYAAAVFAAKLPRASIETVRARRVHGEAKMRFVSLVAHGLSAMSVHSEALAVRLLVGSMVGAALFVGGVLLAAWYAATSGTAVATSVVAGVIVALVLLGELIFLTAMLAFRTLQGRAAQAFLPVRDFRYYIEEPIVVRGRAAAGAAGARRA